MMRRRPEDDRAPTAAPAERTTPATARPPIGPDALLALQRSAGNAAVSRLLSRPASSRRLARRTVQLPGSVAGVTVGGAFRFSIDGKPAGVRVAPPEANWLVDWEIPTTAKSVAIEGEILGVVAGGQFGGKVIARCNVEPDGTLTAVTATPLAGDEIVTGAKPAFTAAVSAVRPDSFDLTAEAVLDASVQSQISDTQTAGGTSGHSGQASTTDTTSTGATDEVKGEDSNIFGRVIREAGKLAKDVPTLGKYIPEDAGEVLTGKPDTKTHTDTHSSGHSTTVTDASHREDRRDASTTTASSGPGLATTAIVRQTITVHVHAAARDPEWCTRDITGFDPGSAKLGEPQHGELQDLIEKGDEPTWLEKLKKGRARIQLYGYASKPGTREVNQQLASDRADAVRRYLTGGSLRIPDAAFDDPIAYGNARTPSTIAEAGGKEKEDDAWRKVKVKLTEVRPGR